MMLDLVGKSNEPLCILWSVGGSKRFNSPRVCSIFEHNDACESKYRDFGECFERLVDGRAVGLGPPGKRIRLNESSRWGRTLGRHAHH